MSCKSKIEIQGHRGARGLMPENTIPAFIKALDYGVHTLELDVVISADKKVVVSHEPYFNPAICLTPEGDRIKDEKIENIYKMDYATIRQYDCGSIGNPRFPEQTKVPAYKPLLSEVIGEVEKYIKEKGRSKVKYNIELKSDAGYDGVWHPAPEEFSNLVYEVINGLLPWERVTIQSFDFRILQYWHQNYPKVQLSALVENKKGSTQNLEALGFIPQIYSPDYHLLTKEEVELLQDKGLKVIPWTVNDPEAMKRLVDWGVDGLITDYPDRAAKIGLL